jgi:large exoprotein involved in heme utilization and adhesion
VSNGGQLESIALGSGAGGDVRIQTGTLSVVDGGQVQSTALGSGAGGEVEIRSDHEIRVSGVGGSDCPGGDCIPSEIVSRAGEDATGNAGRISIETRVLEVLDGARIGVFTEGAADAGTLELVAGAEVLKGVEILASERVTVEGGAHGFSLLGSNTLGTGRAGGLSIAPIQSTDALALELRSGGQVTVSTSGPGDAGSIEIAAHSVEIEGVDPATGKSDSGIFARQNEAGGSGNAGDLNVSAQHLSVSDRGRISVSTRGAGDAGTIALNVGETLTLSGPNLPDKATIEARHDVDGAAGKPGEIRIVAGGEVLLLDGAQITAETRGAERGGNIDIVAGGGVRLSHGSQITAQSQSTGDAGVVEIDAGPRLEVIGSRITTGSTESSGGRVIIRADEMVYLLDGEITTQVASGTKGAGDIFINSDPEPVGEFVVLNRDLDVQGAVDPEPVVEFVVLNRGRIVTANQAEGPGGNIDIATGTLFASTDSVMDAHSALGIDGTVNVKAPETELVMELAALPASYLDASALLASACDARTSRAGSFQVQPRVAVLTPPDAAFAPPERSLSVPAVGTGGVDAPACVPQEVIP